MTEKQYDGFEQIAEADIEAKSVATLRTVPGRGGTYGENGLTAQELKERFDALPKLAIARLHALLAYLDAYINGTENGLESRLGAINIAIASANTGISANSAAISAEVTARKQAIAKEATDRTSAIKTAVDGEASAREAAIRLLKDELLGGASGAYDTLKELEDALTNGESKVIAILAKISAVEASLADKVNTTDVSATATPNTIAKRGASGRLAVGRAAADSDAVPYKQMREELERYLADGGGLPPDLLDGITNAIKMIDTLEAKVANLEAGIAPDMFTVDDTTAYVKTIPTDAAPYAEIQAIGGMTHKVEQLGENLFNPLVVSGYEGEVSAEADGTIYMNWTCFGGWGAMFYDLFPDIVVGKKYIFSASASGGDLQPASIDVGGIPLDTPFTLTEEQYSIHIQLNNGFADDGAAGQPCGGTFVVILREVTDVLIDTPVTALAIKDASGNVINTFAIPAAVQALEGYGKTGYGIEWDEQGKPWWVTTTERTDISAYFTEDNLIPVEGGGTITAVNEHGLAAPTTIVYQAKGYGGGLSAAFDEVHAYAQALVNGGAN
jgi:hypothetical protein